MSIRHIELEEQDKGIRLDKLVSARLPDLSRTQIQQWIKEGNILVNGEVVKPNYKVSTAGTITIEEPELEELDVMPEDLQLNIVYEDEHILVVNKPRGMVVHPAKAHAHGTLVNGLMYHCKDLSGINGVLRPGIVHRIDKDTSGLLLVAKSDQAHIGLVEQLMDRSVKREYVALVHGHIPHNHGTIDAPIGRDDRERKNMAITDKGKAAITHFTVLERFGNFTLVTCTLETGRTHQIRVHMKYIGHPLVGDPKYGLRKDQRFDGQALHAKTVGFTHPITAEYMEFTTEPPEEFKQLVEKIRGES